MKAVRAEILADMLGEVATRLEQAEESGRSKAAENLGGLAKNPALVDAFMSTWLAGGMRFAASEIRHIAGELRPRRRRRA